jgi:CRP-like cAMP-binding protein
MTRDEKEASTVSASAEGEVELLVLSRQDFLNMMNESRATEAHVARDMIKRLISLADFQ